MKKARTSDPDEGLVRVFAYYRQIGRRAGASMFYLYFFIFFQFQQNTIKLFLLGF